MKGFREKLEILKAQHRLRSLKLPGGVDLTSNDYLGMAAHEDLRRAAIEALEGGMDIGAAGSRLLRGHTGEHAALEEFSAGYFGCEKALYFSSGFQANMALFAALPTRHDIIVYDEFVHASARDGIQNAPAKSLRARHNDLQSFEENLQKAQQMRRADSNLWIAVESLYSMDGDFAPLAELYKLAQQFDAVLIVDEAHATGVWGADGKGLAHALPQQNLVVLHTCGKAMGVAGGLVCASADIIDMLINTARPFIYSTAPMPLQAFLVQKSLEILAGADGQARREALFAHIHFLKQQDLFVGAESQIIPVVLGSDVRALHVAESLQDKGFDVRAVRPPTVPEHTARLRVSLSSNLDEKTLGKFSACLSDVLGRDKLAA